MNQTQSSPIQTQPSLYGQLMDSLGQCLTLEVAALIVEMRASADLQGRIEILADRCREGLLTYEEKLEYDTYVHVMDFISILQLKSRKMLGEAAAH